VAAQVALLLTAVLEGFHLPTIQVVTLVLAELAVLVAAMGIPPQMVELAETMEIVLLKAAAQAMLVLAETEQVVTVATAATAATAATVLVPHSYLQLLAGLSQP
jgi:hypothetical protein